MSSSEVVLGVACGGDSNHPIALTEEILCDAPPEIPAGPDDHHGSSRL
jgi:hypothetical protein